MTSDSSKKTKKSKSIRLERTTLRDNLESIAIAVLMVLFLRQMVVEAFKIPTGSMAPSLLGIHREIRCTNCGSAFRVGHDKVGQRGEIICPNCSNKWPGAGPVWVEDFDREPISFRQPEWLWHQGATAIGGRPVRGIEAANRIDRWGSRILVNKFVYRFRRPRRWELAVFDFPYGDKNYIKRIIGLPGEKISIREGNIYVNGEIARKPRAIQERMWMDVLDTRQLPQHQFERWWDFGATPDNWHWDDDEGVLQVNTLDSQEPVLVRYAGLIRDFYAYNGVHNTDGRSGRHRVDEVKIETEVKLQEAERDEGALHFRAAGGGHLFHVAIPVDSERDIILWDADSVVAKVDSPGLHKTDANLISVLRYDKMIIIDVNGEEVIRHYYTTDNNELGREFEQFVGLGASGLKAEFCRVNLQRDVYYLPGRNDFGNAQYALDDSSYFVLGDNSPYSSDSREWESHEVPEENLIGRAFGVFWPVADISLLPAGVRE